jgi:uncharacterized protein (TIGR00297 family)
MPLDKKVGYKCASWELRAVTGTVRRAGVFVALGALSFLVPVLAGQATPTVRVLAAALPFGLVAAGALYLVDGGSDLFETLALAGDREEGRLYSVAGFALAEAGLAILATRFGLPAPAFVASTFVLTTGTLAQALLRERDLDPVLTTTGFVVGGSLVGVATYMLAAMLVGDATTLPVAVFLVTSGALLAALLRTVLFERDDPLVLVSVAFLLWLFVELDVHVGGTRVLVGLAVTVLLGYVAYALGTASLAGMLTGVLLALLAIVLGGYGWFALLITFFGVGGLSSKFRYEEKRTRGIAEANEGARGSGNVLANSAVALVAVVLFAASDTMGMNPALARFAFAGSVAAAMADTLSSEVGGLYDGPRLITTFERVQPGTDGAVTWQGELAGLVGAGLIAGIAAVFFALTPAETGVVLLAGVVGMTADSLLGATLEGGLLDNQGVNFLATLAAALAAALVAAALGVA